MKETGRGVTQWNGEGAFTSEHNYVLVTIVNKFEVEDILNMVYLLDPEAFTTVDEGVKVIRKLPEESLGESGINV